jgi:hypothetical protein
VQYPRSKSADSDPARQDYLPPTVALIAHDTAEKLKAEATTA